MLLNFITSRDKPQFRQSTLSCDSSYCMCKTLVFSLCTQLCFLLSFLLAVQTCQVSIYRTMVHVHVPLYIVSKYFFIYMSYVMLMNVWYMCMYPYIWFLSISLYELCNVDECSRKCFFKKRSLLDFPWKIKSYKANS